MKYIEKIIKEMQDEIANNALKIAKDRCVHEYMNHEGEKPCRKNNGSMNCFKHWQMEIEMEENINEHN